MTSPARDPLADLLKSIGNYGPGQPAGTGVPAPGTASLNANTTGEEADYLRSLFPARPQSRFAYDTSSARGRSNQPMSPYYRPPQLRQYSLADTPTGGPGTGGVPTPPTLPGGGSTGGGFGTGGGTGGVGGWDSVLDSLLSGLGTGNSTGDDLKKPIADTTGKPTKPVSDPVDPGYKPGKPTSVWDGKPDGGIGDGFKPGKTDVGTDGKPIGGFDVEPPKTKKAKQVAKTFDVPSATTATAPRVGAAAPPMWDQSAVATPAAPGTAPDFGALAQQYLPQIQQLLGLDQIQSQIATLNERPDYSQDLSGIQATLADLSARQGPDLSGIESQLQALTSRSGPDLSGIESQLQALSSRSGPDLSGIESRLDEVASRPTPEFDPTPILEQLGGLRSEFTSGLGDVRGQLGGMQPQAPDLSSIMAELSALRETQPGPTPAPDFSELLEQLQANSAQLTGFGNDIRQLGGAVERTPQFDPSSLLANQRELLQLLAAQPQAQPQPYVAPRPVSRGLLPADGGTTKRLY